MVEHCWNGVFTNVEAWIGRAGWAQRRSRLCLGGARGSWFQGGRSPARAAIAAGRRLQQVRRRRRPGTGFLRSRDRGCPESSRGANARCTGDCGRHISPLVPARYGPRALERRRVRRRAGRRSNDSRTGDRRPLSALGGGRSPHRLRGRAQEPHRRSHTLAVVPAPRRRRGALQQPAGAHSRRERDRKRAGGAADSHARRARGQKGPGRPRLYDDRSGAFGQRVFRP